MTSTENNEANIIPAHLAIKGMRDSGYKNTAYALAELIDNSQQAEASLIEVICLENVELIQSRKRKRIFEIAVLDDGKGMDSATLRRALQFGNGDYLDDRTGIGRFGMGLPNASISQADRVDVWTWQNGSGNALYSYLDVEQIINGDLRVVPEPVRKPIPDKHESIYGSDSESGTLVVWSNLVPTRLSWKTAKATLENTEREVGRIHRRFIMSGDLAIRLIVSDLDGMVSYDEYANFDDPLYLTPSNSVPSPFDKSPMFEEWENSRRHKIKYNNKTHYVTVKYSIASKRTIEEAEGKRNRGETDYGTHAKKNTGISVMRAGRELMLDRGWCISYDPRERWWGAEIEFPTALDEIFGVTNNKQAATHFSELVDIDWKDFAEDDEGIIEVVRRLKSEGDYRGYLLELSDLIKIDLGGLRRDIRAQGALSRTSKRRGGKNLDSLTPRVNRGWIKRSEERPIEGEDTPRTDEDFQEILQDLMKNKKYDKDDADDITDSAREKDWKIIFVDADFPNDIELFNVEVKGNTTVLTFNRQHVAFNDVFNIINMDGEDFGEMSPREIVELLKNVVDSTKIIFAAWARYEREVGREKVKELQKHRRIWGEIAERFLDPDDDYEI